MSGWDSLSWEAKRGAVLAQALFICEMCRNADAEDVDHIWPRSKGGTDARYNLRAACKPCNRSKGSSIRFVDLDADVDLLLEGILAAELDAKVSVYDAIRWSAMHRLMRLGLPANEASAGASATADESVFEVSRRISDLLRQGGAGDLVPDPPVIPAGDLEGAA